MKLSLVMAGLLCAMVASLFTGCVTAKGSSVAQKRAYIQKMRDDTLKELAAGKPETVAMARDLPGYAVFDHASIKILTMGTGNGYGIVVEKKTGKETYMRAGQVNVGLGAGVKRMRTIVFFRTQAALEQMVNVGFSAGAEASAAAKAGDQGAATSGRESVDRDVVIYQLTDAGVALSASVGGTKIWKDDELN